MRRALRRGVLLGLGAVIATIIGLVLSGSVREVRGGQVYRSGQLNGERLERAIIEKRIRTIVNLRGCCPSFPWYLVEAETANRMGVSQEDVFLSAIRLPTPTEVRRLIEVLDESEHPVLLHCRQGVDRTGLASVIVQLLQPGISLTEARRHLSVGYGYLPVNGTENMNRFFDFYESWLNEHGLQHTPTLFRHWATREYCPGACRVEYRTNAWPKEIRAGRRLRLTLDAFNTSIHSWQFRSGTGQGVHGRYSIKSADGRTVFHERCGLFETQVPPGNSVKLGVGVPGLLPGNYALNLDMIDRDGNAFCQFGSEPLVWEFVVVE
jgi:protein tyrosine phosphatase (PTP) superfamily phosphohydrolase (DUF442 family)